MSATAACLVAGSVSEWDAGSWVATRLRVGGASVIACRPPGPSDEQPGNLAWSRGVALLLRAVEHREHMEPKRSADSRHRRVLRAAAHCAPGRDDCVDGLLAPRRRQGREPGRRRGACVRQPRRRAALGVHRRGRAGPARAHARRRRRRLGRRRARGPAHGPRHHPVVAGRREQHR